MERLTVALEIREEKHKEIYQLIGFAVYHGFLRKEQKEKVDQLWKELDQLDKEIHDLTK